MKAKTCWTMLMMLTSLTILPGCQGGAQLKPEQQNDNAAGRYSLDFDVNNFTEKTVTVDNKTITYRAYGNLVYVKNPVDTNYEIMNIYIPKEYFEGKAIGSYTADTAPIFFPNTVGGYMPGAPGTIDKNPGPGGPPDRAPGDAAPGVAEGRPGVGPTGGAPDGGQNAAAIALAKGYVVAEAGARGRTTQNEQGQYTGKAPAAIVDLKAAVRYLRYNDKVMPGDAEKIIANGTSAGGALSALLGATGNSADYEPYLKELGAAATRDDVFAASAYCPITNLDHADAAYEWQFAGILDYNNKMGGGAGTLTVEQNKLSQDLKKLFPAYLNTLGLKAADGTALTLSQNGEGSFREYLKSFVLASAQKALDSGMKLTGLNWLTIKNGKVTDVDLAQYNKYVGRMKRTPAFDDVGLTTAENDEFGTATIKAQHFTQFAKDHSTAANASLADPTIVKLMNPMDYIGTKDTTTARYWRIRYGSVDNNTALAIPLILATKLQNSGYDADFAVPWGIGHAGDYDLDELFAWMDKICQTK